MTRLGGSIFILLAIARMSELSGSESRPFLGVRHYQLSRTEPRLVSIHILEVDLRAPGIDVAITRSNGPTAGETTGETTRQFLERLGAQIAINGSFSAGIGDGQFEVEGLAASGGDIYSSFEPFRTQALNISADQVATIVRSTTGTGIDHVPNVELYNVLGGEARLVRNGLNVAPSENESLHPRTAIGVSADQTKLLLLTVDGRNPGHSLGMTRPEIADVLIAYGAHNAMNLDGGGSTTLVMADPIVRIANTPVGIDNRPGSERVVGSNFAIFARPVMATDLNHDGTVDAADAALLFADWGRSSASDLTRDGIVDGADAGLLFTDWTGDTRVPVSCHVSLFSLCAALYLGRRAWVPATTRA